MKTSNLCICACLPTLLLAAILNVGSGETYSTVSSPFPPFKQSLTNDLQITSAYNAAAAGDTIYVYPGTYKEKLTARKNSITLKGSAYPSKNPSENEALLTYSTYASDAGNDDASGSFLPPSPLPFSSNLTSRPSNTPHHRRQLQLIQHERQQHGRHRWTSRRAIYQRRFRRFLCQCIVGLARYAVFSYWESVFRQVLH
jgi:hypothetical protein